MIALYCWSIILGVTVGTLYARSCATSYKTMLFARVATPLRMIFFFMLVSFLLRLKIINLILFLPSFLLTFWLFLLTKKVWTHEQS